MSKVSNKETDFNTLLESSLSMENRLDSLRFAIISNEGLNHDFVSELEKISPGCILDNKPRGLIIHEPNQQNLVYAVESIDRLKTALTIGLVGAIIMMIMKFFSRFGSGGGDGYGGGGGGGGHYSIKDPKETIDNLLEQDEKVKKHIQENVEKIKGEISHDVMLKANIKSDAIHLLKKCGKDDKEIEALTKNEQALTHYFFNVKQLENDVRWHNGGNRIPIYITSQQWHTNLTQLLNALDIITKTYKQRWEWTLKTYSAVGIMYDSMDNNIFQNHNATAPFSAVNLPNFDAFMRDWTRGYSIPELHSKEPMADLDAIKKLSTEQKIDGESIGTDFMLDIDRSAVATYFSNRIRSIRFHDNDSRTRMPDFNDFPTRLDYFQRVATKANAFILDVSNEFNKVKSSLDTNLGKWRSKTAERNDLPIEIKKTIFDGLTYSTNNLKFLGDILGSLMTLHGIFEETTKAYQQGIDALKTVNTDLDNLLKGLQKAKAKLEKEKERNDVHQH